MVYFFLHDFHLNPWTLSYKQLTKECRQIDDRLLTNGHYHTHYLPVMWSIIILHVVCNACTGSLPVSPCVPSTAEWHHFVWNTPTPFSPAYLNQSIIKLPLPHLLPFVTVREQRTINVYYCARSTYANRRTLYYQQIIRSIIALEKVE